MQTFMQLFPSALYFSSSETVLQITNKKTELIPEYN